MSGGAFDYSQYQIGRIAEEVKDVIVKNKVEVPIDRIDKWCVEEDGTIPEWAKYYYNLDDETIAKFKEGYRKLREAYIYAQRIDWLLSGDDGEKEFHKRLKQDLEELDTELQNEKWLYTPEEED